MKKALCAIAVLLATFSAASFACEGTCPNGVVSGYCEVR